MVFDVHVDTRFADVVAIFTKRYILSFDIQ